MLEIDQPKISALAQGKLAGFSLERLFRFLAILGQDITIKITPKKNLKKQANVTVVMPKRTKQPVVKPHEVSLGKALQAKKKK